MRWFSSHNGLLDYMVHWPLWLAVPSGSLYILAGLLLRLVLFDIWLAIFCGSLAFLAC